jgi:hypothetical protein
MTPFPQANIYEETNIGEKEKKPVRSLMLLCPPEASGAHVRIKLKSSGSKYPNLGDSLLIGDGEKEKNIKIRISAYQPIIFKINDPTHAFVYSNEFKAGTYQVFATTIKPIHHGAVGNLQRKPNKNEFTAISFEFGTSKEGK